jgi:hypothetical protein
MSRIFLKKLAGSAVPGVYSGTVLASLGSGRYRVVAADGTRVEATTTGRSYARGDLVRLRGTEIIGLRQPAATIKKFEV